MMPLYTNYTSLSGCFSKVPETRWMCFVALRNTPYNDWEPAIAVWPLTTEHVQASVKFAIKHKLCVMVLGTGHDFLNRHSCNNGILIRTTLLKSSVWNLDDPRSPGGSVTFGPGKTFSEGFTEYAEMMEWVEEYRPLPNGQRRYRLTERGAKMADIYWEFWDKEPGRYLKLE